MSQDEITTQIMARVERFHQKQITIHNIRLLVVRFRKQSETKHLSVRRTKDSDSS